jgi:hypothetical protein
MFSMMSAAVKVMQHQQQLEKDDPATSDGSAQAEQLRLMLDAMWASNALDIQTTVARACQLVCPLTQAACMTRRQPAFVYPAHGFHTIHYKCPRFDSMSSLCHFSCSVDQELCVECIKHDAHV